MKRDKLLLLTLTIISGCCLMACSLLSAPLQGAQSGEAQQTVTQVAPVVPAGEVFTPSPLVLTVCNCLALNVRAAPSPEAAILATLNAGDVVTVREVGEGWAWVAGGWVNARYLCK